MMWTKRFYFYLFTFETNSHYVALGDLELTMKDQAGLTLTEICLPVFRVLRSNSGVPRRAFELFQSGLITSLSQWCSPIIPALGKEAFKTSPSYIVSLRPICVTWNLVSTYNLKLTAKVDDSLMSQCQPISLHLSSKSSDRTDIKGKQIQTQFFLYSNFSYGGWKGLPSRWPLTQQHSSDLSIWGLDLAEYLI